MKKMRQFVAMLVITIFSCSIPVLSHAEEYNMNTLTCQEFVNQSSAEEMVYIMFWIDGYMSHAQNNTVINDDELAQNLETLIEHCQQNPSSKVMDLVAQ